MTYKLERHTKIKPSAEGRLTTTSVSVEKRHLDFVRTRNLNLSSLVRELLDKLIKSADKDAEDT